MKKPKAEDIRHAPPLSKKSSLIACNICGLPETNLRAWREHDEKDRPIPGPEHLVFVGYDHKKCLATMEAHPRLYAEVTGEPGTFPRLCGMCRYRSRFDCLHPKLKK